jgi:hypothetical protein
MASMGYFFRPLFFWNRIDQLSDKMRRWSPCVYAFDNPIEIIGFKMRNFVILLAILFSLLCNSCDSITPGRENCSMSDSLTSDVPVNRTDSTSVNIKNRIELLAGLTRIDTGFNGLQIRIWYSYSSDVEHLILLIDSNNHWSGSLNTLRYVHDRGNLISVSRTIKEIFPQSGWTMFIDSLKTMGILTLPDMSTIPNYESGTDGNWLTVEFANCRKYRYYSYQSPWGYVDEFWQAKR